METPRVENALLNRYLHPDLQREVSAAWCKSCKTRRRRWVQDPPRAASLGAGPAIHDTQGDPHPTRFEGTGGEPPRF